MGKNDGDENALLLCNQLCFAVYSTAHAFNRLYKVHLDAIGLTYPQYLVMLTLWEGDNLTVKDLGERLDLDSGTLTPLLKRLETAGLVRRARDPRDERLVRLSLTDPGTALREKAQAIPQAIAAAAGCSPRELMALRAALLKVRDNLNTASRQFS